MCRVKFPTEDVVSALSHTRGHHGIHFDACGHPPFLFEPVQCSSRPAPDVQEAPAPTVRQKIQGTAERVAKEFHKRSEYRICLVEALARLRRIVKPLAAYTVSEIDAR